MMKLVVAAIVITGIYNGLLHVGTGTGAAVLTVAGAFVATLILALLHDA